MIRWCTCNYDHYTHAKNLYNEKIEMFIDDWVRYMCEEYPDYTRNCSDKNIKDAFYTFTSEIFEKGFIWNVDTNSILEAEKWDDAGIFDTSPMEQIIEYLNSND